MNGSFSKRKPAPSKAWSGFRESLSVAIRGERGSYNQFLKLFTRNIALTFDLTSPGIKAFNVLCWAVQAGALAKDEVALDSFALEDFLAAHQGRNPPIKDFSIATFKRGLAELETAKLIAKTVRKGRYFVNPSFVFNGDRVAFSTVIERKKESLQDELEARGQQRLEV